MIAIEASSADDAWRKLARLLQAEVKIQPGRDQSTRELLHVIVSLADSRQRIVFARPFNPAFAIAEVIWILSGANASEFVADWNPRMRRFVDEDANVLHGAYGYRLGSRPRLSKEIEQTLQLETGTVTPRLDQIRTAYEALRYSPDSRQVVLQIWNAAIDLPNPAPRSADVPCNIVSHLMIRENRLEWLQIMRSNDLIWGMPYNVIQFTCLQEIMAGWLGVDVGSYVQLSDSLHVYQRHWDELDALILEQEGNAPVNRTDLRIKGYDEWEVLWRQIVESAVALSKGVTPREALDIFDQVSDLPTGYVEWVALLAAESLRRVGHYDESLQMIEQAGAYWEASWRQWNVWKLHKTDSLKY